MRVTGSHFCQGDCVWSDRATFVAIPSSQDEEATPLPDVILLPASSREVTQEIKLQVAGDPIRYPFDSYRLAVGIVMERVYADGTVQVMAPADADGHLFITLSSRLPLSRTRLSRRLSLQELGANPDGYQYVAAARLVFTRPLYVQLLTVLLVLLIAIASAFAVFMRPVRELITSAGALILGVWGVRTILLGNSLPGLSAVDLALAMVILFLLAAIAFRAFGYLEGLAGKPFRRRIRRRSLPEKETTSNTSRGE